MQLRRKHQLSAVLSLAGTECRLESVEELIEGFAGIAHRRDGHVVMVGGDGGVLQSRYVVDAVDGVVCDPAQDFAQVCFGVQAVELSGTDEAVDSRRALSCVIVDLDAPIVAVPCEGFPARERVADGTGEF